MQSFENRILCVKIGGKKWLSNTNRKVFSSVRQSSSLRSGRRKKIKYFFKPIETSRIVIWLFGEFTYISGEKVVFGHVPSCVWVSRENSGNGYSFSKLIHKYTCTFIIHEVFAGTKTRKVCFAPTQSRDLYIARYNSLDHHTPRTSFDFHHRRDYQLCINMRRHSATFFTRNEIGNRYLGQFV